MYKRLLLLSCLSASLCASSAFAASGYYVSGNTGIFQGNFNQQYLDRTDIVLQNIQQTVQQNGYTFGAAGGYSKMLNPQVSLGAELSINWDTNQSTFQSGASSSAFSDTIQIKNHIDLVVVPGLLLTDTVMAYAKLGLSFASMQDVLNSPVGTLATGTSYSTKARVIGFAGGLGVRKYVTPRVSLSVEGNYHDYGTKTLSDFQNFSAGYSHNAHIYASTVTAGITYHF